MLKTFKFKQIIFGVAKREKKELKTRTGTVIQCQHLENPCRHCCFTSDHWKKVHTSDVFRIITITMWCTSGKSVSRETMSFPSSQKLNSTCERSFSTVAIHQFTPLTETFVVNCLILAN